MKITNPEGSIGPVDVTTKQAEEIKRRLSEVPRVKGVPMAVQEVSQGLDRVRLSVEAVVGDLGSEWVQMASTDKPVFPAETRTRIEQIFAEVLAA